MVDPVEVRNTDFEAPKAGQADFNVRSLIREALMIPLVTTIIVVCLHLIH